MSPPMIAMVNSDEPAPLTSHRRPLRALTGIRFVAAMQVVFFHFGASFALRHSSTRVLGNFLANGWVAVTLFFVLSGFILSYTYAGQIEEPRGKRRFWEARFARIYPVYVLSLALMMPFQDKLSFGTAAAVALMLQTWNPVHPEFFYVWNLTAWTLSMELFFYLLFPFLLPPLQRMSRRTLKAILSLTLLLIVFGHTMTHSIEPLSRRLLIPMPLFRLPEFVVGMILGLLFLRPRKRRRSSMWTYASLIGILAVLLGCRDRWVSLVVIPYAVLIYDLAATNSKVARLLGSNTCVLLGAASYAIYLLQVPVRSWVHLALTGNWNLNVNHSGMDSLLSPPVLIGMSILAFRFWEEPARKWLRNWFKRKIESGIVPVSETAP